MSNRVAKKIRKLYKQTMADEARRVGAKLGDAVRKKPKYMPLFIWVYLVKLVLDI